MVAKINADTSNGVIITSDNSGELELQSTGVTKAKVTANGLQDANGNSYGLSKTSGMYRNRIINGDMVIDQRNNGSSATANANAYFIDRLQLQASGSPPVLTGQRVTDAPNDFKYSMKFTTNATTDTLTANEAVTPRQNIEGYNVADFNFGNAYAKEFTVSFWVKGSVTGTYGFTVMNATFDRHYVTTYNINSANTWEKKTITLTADTSGTWDTTTGVGVRIMFPLDTGPDLETATTETWGDTDKRRTVSCVKLLQSSSATWQVTGLQVELGSGASDFEFLPYDVQLARCQRYCYKIGGDSAYAPFAMGTSYNTTNGNALVNYPVAMRATPTMTPTYPIRSLNGGATRAVSAVSFGQGGATTAYIDYTTTTTSSGQAVMLTADGTAAANLLFTAEL